MARRRENAGGAAQGQLDAVLLGHETARASGKRRRRASARRRGGCRRYCASRLGGVVGARLVAGRGGAGRGDVLLSGHQELACSSFVVRRAQRGRVARRSAESALARSGGVMGHSDSWISS